MDESTIGWPAKCQHLQNGQLGPMAIVEITPHPDKAPESYVLAARTELCALCAGILLGIASRYMPDVAR